IVGQITSFKPEVAKYVYLKYSEPGALCNDCSAGFGSRLLGCVTTGRKYIGVDPLTIPELEEMKKDLGLQNCELIQGCSERIDFGENVFDLAFSSPPYYDMEIYSSDKTQAYNNGADYFYNTYW